MLSPGYKLLLVGAPVENTVEVPVIVPLVSMATVPVIAVVATELVASARKYVPTPVIVAEPAVVETTPLVEPLAI